MKATTTPIAQVQTATPRVVCELDASSRAEALLEVALGLCAEHGATLAVVWVLEPRVFQDPFPGSAGAVGTFGLPFVLHAAVERATRRGIPVTSAVRVGKREVVLRQESEVAGTVAALRLDDSRDDLAGAA